MSDGGLNITRRPVAPADLSVNDLPGNCPLALRRPYVAMSDAGTLHSLYPVLPPMARTRTK